MRSYFLFSFEFALGFACCLLISTDSSAAVYTVKSGTTFHIEPNGELLKVFPGMVETPPLARKKEWCLLKMMDGRGAAINPQSGWTKCSNLHKFVGF